MDQGAVTQAVRDRLGLLDIDMSDAVIVSCTKGAVTVFAKNVPKETFGTFNVQKGVDTYGFPEDVDDIAEILYDRSLFGGGDIFDEDLKRNLIGIPSNAFGGDVFENSSLIPIFFAKLKAFYANFDFEITFKVLETASPRQIQLNPTPTSDGLAYFSGTLNTAVTDISPDDEETFLMAVFWKVAETRANKLRVVNSLTQGGGISMQPAHKEWLDMAKYYREQFEGLSGGFAGMVFIG